MQRGAARAFLIVGIILKIAAACIGAALIWYAFQALSPCVAAEDLSFADPSLFGRDAFGKEKARKGVDGLPAITDAAYRKKIGLFVPAFLLALEGLVSAAWVGSAFAGSRRVRNAPVLWLALAAPPAIAATLAYIPGADDVYCTCEADQTIMAAAGCDRTRKNLLRYRAGVKLLVSILTPAYAIWGGAALSAIGGILAAIGNRPTTASKKRGGGKRPTPPAKKRASKKDDDEERGKGSGDDDDDDDDEDESASKKLLRKKRSVV